MAPMTRCRAIGNIPNELMATYYGQRSGAGLIITEGTAPSPNALGYARIPGMYSDEQVEGWKKVVDEVHRKNGKIFCQLMHTGRVSHPANMPPNSQILAPSAIKLEDTKMYVDNQGELKMPVAKAMDKNEIEKTIDEYRHSAANAIRAGFDGVEIHGANGYLIQQFLNTASNHRQDEYGGSIANRCRFGLKVVEAISSEIGPERTGIRLSPFGVMNEMEHFDEIEDQYLYFVTQLNRLDIAYVHLVDHESMGAPEVPEEIKREIRILFKNSLILSGGYDKERAEHDLSKGHADLIAFGRPFISNPDLVTRFYENAKLAIPNTDLFYTPGEEGYTDYEKLHEKIKI